MKNPFLQFDKKILADSGSSGEVEKNLLHLCDIIGPRFAGTPTYKTAADWMAATFKRYRVDSVQLEPFSFLAWRRGKAGRLELKAPLTRDYPCYTLPYSAPTDPGGVTGSLIDVGAGDPALLKKMKRKLHGRIVLSTGTATHRTEICEILGSCGARGFVLAGSVPGQVLPTGSVANGETCAMPAVSIGKESALELGRLSKRAPLKLSLTTDCCFEKDTTWNVVAQLDGSGASDELVLMGGHLDSHELCPGAKDNGAGAVQVLEVARLLARQKKHLSRPVRLIGFGAEECGLLGSHHHARTHAGELRKARFMLNSDCPSLGSPKGLVFHECPGAEAYLEALSGQMETPIAYRSRFHCHSDHYPFVLKGLPTAGMACGDFAPAINHFVHMAGDTADKISMTDLRDGAAFAARILFRASNDEAWPNMRRTPAQVRKLVGRS